ncbi:sensor histidine kinase [Bowmanella denitrificans]|uniref:sensor histidine kinase n=1 Tax=Bowmanella denitrificans TaxID=366582 RepID=UPI001559A7EE|nr:histidine kinase [Bowmanella denitrificans]
MKRTNRLKYKVIGLELGLGLLTWAVISFVTLYFWLHGDANFQSYLAPNPMAIAFVCLLLVLFLAGYLERLLGRRALWIGPLVQFLCLLALMWLFPNGLVLVLGIMLVAHLGELFVKPWICVLICLIIPAINFLWSPMEYGLVNTALFITLNLFALLVSTRLEAERRAKEANAHLLRELRATQSLLHTTTRRDERLRIARDLHDVLGHHLTALSIQLEVANQLSRDTAQKHIQRAQELAKLLLSDVREAVADIRRSNQLDIASAIQTLIQDLNSLDIALEVADDLVITDARVAEALFRCAQEAITNVLKHSDANHCRLRLDKHQGVVKLLVADNGSNNKQVVAGHGLSGMRERLNKLDGDLQFENSGSGFCLIASVPDS